MKPSDIRIDEVSFAYEDYRYRTPIKFGGVALDQVTLLNATMTVETEGGRVARGFGSMPLGNVWAWPTKELSYGQTLAAMKTVAEKIAAIYRSARLNGHPVEITHTLEPVL